MISMCVACDVIETRFLNLKTPKKTRRLLICYYACDYLTISENHAYQEVLFMALKIAVY